jgi:hypothetical protein
MDTLLKNRVLYTLKDYSLAIPEINSIHGFLHNHTNCLIRITDVLEDMIQENIIQISDIPNIVLLLATVFRETQIKSGERIDPEILTLLIKITAFCILDTNLITKLYVIHLPENQNEMVIESMVNTCLELLQMTPIAYYDSLSSYTTPSAYQSSKKCWDWF